MANKLDRMVLVLNRGWSAHHIKSVREAISDVVAGVAFVLDGDDLYDWETWQYYEPLPGEDVISGPMGNNGLPKYQFRVPEIIVLKTMGSTKHRETKWSRRNVFLRDRYQCQYCGKSITLSNGTIDHVSPRAAGGGNTWENTVACCKPCNSLKKDKTLQQLGWTIRTQPCKPKWYPLSTRLTQQHPASWDRFLPDKSRIPDYFKHGGKETANG